MIPLHEFILFIIASLTINLIPGPDMLFVMSRTVSHGPRGGLLSVAGISTGLGFHTVAVASGLSLLILHFHLAFLAIKWLGAAYLCYFGIKLLFSTVSQIQGNETGNAKLSGRKIFTQALITNLLNPKIIVFFLAFLPQFVTPGEGRTFVQLLILGLTFITTGAWFYVDGKLPKVSRNQDSPCQSGKKAKRCCYS